jgi:hypothetical protein
MRVPRLPALLRRREARSRISWFRRIMGVSSIGRGIISPASAVPGATVSRRDRREGVVYSVDGSVVAAGRGGVIGFGAEGRTSSGSPKSSKSSNSASF